MHASALCTWLVPAKARRERRIHREQSYERLLTDTWVLGAEPGSPARAAGGISAHPVMTPCRASTGVIYDASRGYRCRGNDVNEPNSGVHILVQGTEDK